METNSNHVAAIPVPSLSRLRCHIVHGPSSTPATLPSNHHLALPPRRGEMIFLISSFRGWSLLFLISPRGYTRPEFSVYADRARSLLKRRTSSGSSSAAALASESPFRSKASLSRRSTASRRSRMLMKVFSRTWAVCVSAMSLGHVSFLRVTEECVWRFARSRGEVMRF